MQQAVSTHTFVVCDWTHSPGEDIKGRGKFPLAVLSTRCRNSSSSARACVLRKLTRKRFDTSWEYIYVYIYIYIWDLRQYICEMWGISLLHGQFLHVYIHYKVSLWNSFEIWVLMTKINKCIYIITKYIH